MSITPETATLLRRAHLSVRKRQYCQAIDLFHEALRENSQQPEIHEGLATSYFLAQDYERAAQSFLQLTRLTPFVAKPFINLGAVYCRLHEYEKAADVLQRALQKDRKRWEAYYNLGIAYRGLNELGMAVSAYKEAIRLNPQVPEVLQNLANAYLEMGNYRQAIAHYNQALAIRPNFEQAIQGLKQAERAMAQARAAINPFGRLVGPAPKAKPVLAKELSDQERAEDRQVVYALATDIVAYSKELIVHIRDDVEPSLMALRRVIAQAADRSNVVSQAYAGFKSASDECRDRCRVLRGRLLELQSHEEFLKANR